MSEIPTLLFVLASKYLIPGIFAIGLIVFVYGVIEYFIIGEGGDEERAEHGRELFVKAASLFIIGMIAFGVLSLFSWIGGVIKGNDSGGSVSLPGVRVEDRQDVLPVPNVPRGND